MSQGPQSPSQGAKQRTQLKYFLDYLVAVFRLSPASVIRSSLRSKRYFRALSRLDYRGILTLPSTRISALHSRFCG